MPGLAELREWLREEKVKAVGAADMSSVPIYWEGKADAFSDCLDELLRLESLDSSPDLPSTKG